MGTIPNSLPPILKKLNKVLSIATEFVLSTIFRFRNWQN
jgi:hypothetical protein